MKRNRAEQNQHTREFIFKQTGIELTDGEAEEVRQSLVQYCQILLEIAQVQQEEQCL